MRNIQDPVSRIQRRSKHQTPSNPLRLVDLVIWSFSGCWMLDVASFGRTCLLVLVATIVSTCSTHSQTNTTSAGNRYLFIIETSRSMQHRSGGMLAAVQQLLNSGIGGQLMRGDTLGIWTYNENLYPGRFPLQHWSPETHRTIVSRALDFLQGQKLEKQCTFVPVLPALEALVKNSPFLTVIIVSVGEQKLQGTPYDDQINALYTSWAQEQQKARMPFLTILRAKAGMFTDFSVNAAPWPVEMPPLPKELFIAQTPEKKSTPPSAKPPPPIGRNIIVSGKKTPAPERQTTAFAKTNSPNQIGSDQLPQTVPNSPDATLALSLQPAAAPGPAPAPETSKAATSSDSLPNQAPEKLSSPGAPASLVTNESVVATKSHDSSADSPQNPPASLNALANQTLAITSTASEPFRPAPTLTDSARNPEPEAQKPPSSVRLPSSVPIVAIAPKAFFDRTTILLLAISAVAAVLVLAWIWFRRSRAARHVSLITRSLDHEKP